MIQRAIAALLCCGAAWAGTTANVKDGVILEGYDAVSYFESAAPVKGKPELSVTRDGATYWFATEANKKKFEADGKKYEPAYEGWCATAVAKGRKYRIDPTNFKVTNGRLFLFYKGWKGDAKQAWVKDEPNMIQKADANWPKVKTTEE